MTDRATFRIALASMMIAGLFPSCLPRETVQQVAVSQALTDGFEVVVLTVDDQGNLQQVDSFKLAEARTRLGDGALALIPPGLAEQAASRLQQAAGEDGDFFVTLEVEDEPGGGQRVTSGFHYGNRTYTYCYVASAEGITPVWSAYRDLRRSTRTEYAPS